MTLEEKNLYYQKIVETSPICANCEERHSNSATSWCFFASECLKDEKHPTFYINKNKCYLISGKWYFSIWASSKEEAKKRFEEMAFPDLDINTEQYDIKEIHRR